MKKIILLICIALTFNACTSTLQLQPSVTKANGVQVVEIPEAKTKLEYPGDYWFHDFDADLFPNAHPDFLILLRKEGKVKGQKMLFAGHTTIQPYFATASLLYDNPLNIDKYLRNKEEKLVSQYNASNFERNTL